MVAKRLRWIRKRSGLSQASFAQKAGYSREGYANYERGTRTLPREAQLKIIDCFGEDPFDLSKNDGRTKLIVGTIRETASENPISRQFHSFIRIRLKLQNDYECFLAEACSSLRRKWIFFRESTFIFATVCFSLRYFIAEFSEVIEFPVLAIDWLLLISFAILVVLLPFQLGSFARFAYWRRQTNKA